MSLPEAKVLENLNTVSTAKRLANMVRLPFSCFVWPDCLIVFQELHDSDFGKREEIHRAKRAKRMADVEAI